MSVQRSPPNTPNQEVVQSKKNTLAIPQSGSTPNLTAIDDENITTRFKRKRSDDSICMEEIRRLLAAAAAQSESKYESLQATISAIKAQNDEIKNHITFISKQYDDMLVKIDQLESERRVDRCRIQSLEDTVENLERQLQSTKVEIKNVPKMKGESKDDLCELVKATASALNIPIQNQDIKDVFRIYKKDDPSSSLIMVDFLSASTKETIIRGARQFNVKNKDDKLNTSHLKIEGPKKPVYLSEKLTYKAQRLYYIARTFAKDNDYKYCWSSFGKIYLRKMEGQKQIPICNEADLNSLRVDK